MGSSCQTSANEVNTQDFEKLGLFYLGKRFDLASQAVTDDLVLYESRDLTTHGVCIGMTGSGKTGLCLTILEEAAIDGIPVIAIDPKGDLSNIFLNFPNLDAQSFLPWVNEEDARRNNLTVEQLAQQEASKWKNGIEAWGQSAERIQKLKDAVEFRLYTPGSSAGLGVSVLKSLTHPEDEAFEDADILKEKVASTASSLLALLGIDADPLRSREHILLSSVIAYAWKSKHDLELTDLITQIQKPQFTKVGAIDLESFYPAKERFELAMSLNNLLAAPGFESWMSGEPLQIDSLLFNAQGKPRVCVFSIAHLSETERMFFVSVLLNEVLSWVRAQSGTTSLRALLYMDEIFGYFPPVANPPSKKPLLTLLKQARAYGLGLLLATQNPVDLDYKGLANAGTWWIGRLQTERDKQRVIEALEGASAEAGGTFNRNEMERTIAGLGSRVFLMNNVHDERPEIFQTRWTLSYLRGPLARPQIKKLAAMQVSTVSRSATATAPQMESASIAKADSVLSLPSTNVSCSAKSISAMTSRPIVPPTIKEYFLPVKTVASKVVYKPMIFGGASVRFVDIKLGLDEVQARNLVAPLSDGAVEVSWSEASKTSLELSDLEAVPVAGAEFQPLPSSASSDSSYKQWSKDFVEWLYQHQKFYLLKEPKTKQCSRPSETERDFRIRLHQLCLEARDKQVDELKKKYAPKLQTLQDRVRTAEHKLEVEQAQAKQAEIDSAITFGTSIIGAMLGRKRLTKTALDRASRVARGAGKVAQGRSDVERATETLGTMRERLEELETEFQSELAKIAACFTGDATLETISVAAKKTNISLKLIALVWAPYGVNEDLTLKELWR